MPITDAQSGIASLSQAAIATNMMSAASTASVRFSAVDIRRNFLVMVRLLELQEHNKKTRFHRC